MSDVIRWEEPPAAHGNTKHPRKPAKYQATADALRARPGQWAVVIDMKSPGTCGALAYRIRQGVGPFAPVRAFEAKTVGPAGGQSSKVYARYVGEPS